MSVPGVFQPNEGGEGPWVGSPTPVRAGRAQGVPSLDPAAPVGDGRLGGNPPPPNTLFAISDQTRGDVGGGTHLQLMPSDAVPPSPERHAQHRVS